MLVFLILTDRIISITLPNKFYGVYWVTLPALNGIENNLIGIEADNEKWKLKSNNETTIVENGQEIDFRYLQNNRFYQLLNKKENKHYILYCLPIYDSSFANYSITKTPITIGKSETSDIKLLNNSVDDLQASIAYENGTFNLYNNSNNYGVYVNNYRVNQNIKINSGDVIFVSGIRMIPIIKDNQPCILVNNPNNWVKINTKSLNPLYVMNLGTIDMNLNKDDLVIYNENDYFHKKPRFKETISNLVINVDAPPVKPKNSDMPGILTVGPMLTSSVISVLYGYMTISNIVNNGSNWLSAWPMFMVSILSLMATLVWPFIIRKYTKYKQKKQEKIRKNEYNKYIDEIINVINQTSNMQSQILNDNNPSLSECKKIVETKNANFWNRKTKDADFLNVTLGYGDIPMDIAINVPEIHFSLDKDELLEKVSSIKAEHPILKNAPIVQNLSQKKVVASIGNYDLNKKFIDNIIFQLATLHSYEDLKIVILTDEQSEKQKHWEYAKILPHCWSADKTIRFYGTSRDEIRDICYYLDTEFSKRLNNKVEKIPFYLIITDNYKVVRNYDFIKKFLSVEELLGFSMLIVNDKIFNLPAECNTFIDVTNKSSEVFNNELNSKIQKFNIDFNTDVDYYQYSKMMANIPIEEKDDKVNLPDKLGFLELYNVGTIEQLNILNRWKDNNPVSSLQTLIGIDQNGEKVSLDLHERFHGPHGLIAGMTGSGKSEFIATYILSLAVNYDPREVQFVLIDYKGGGLAGIFENKITGVKLPHLIGTITNLDTNEIKRSLASLDSELKRRQKKFNEVRDQIGDSAVDIYKYQELYRLGVIKEPISHLFIICDEFAELKLQQPEFLQQLISISRIGRSLGIHLILATQKPSGIVDDQIWSNSKFKICLRVQEKSDSTEVIKRPDAALLKNTGRFYMQVGYDEIFLLGQAAWSGKKYVPVEKLKIKIDNSVEVVNNIGYTVKKVGFDNNDQPNNNYGAEIKNIVNHLYDLSKKENLNIGNLWLDKLPEYINISDLKQKYNFQKTDYLLDVPIGEYDIPGQQRQDLLSLNFSKVSNMLLYGSTGSGKENFLTTLLYSSITSYDPMDVIYYILDFGSQSLNVFKDVPHIGDIIDSSEFEKVKNLIKLLNLMCEERKNLFVNFNGEYDLYIRNGGSKIPRVILIINNYDAFLELYGMFEDSLVQLTREGSKFGIHVIITVSNANSIRYKLRQNFNTEYVLQLNNESDYSNILGNINKNYPSKYFGRGIFKTDNIYEFQTAMVSQRESIYDFIKSERDKLITNNDIKAMAVPVLPDIVTRENIINSINYGSSCVIGIEKENLDICNYTFSNNYVNLFLSYAIAF